MRVENAIDIAASAERVWELTIAVEEWPVISPTMTTVERLGDEPMGIGSAARVQQPAQPARTWTVTTFVPLQCFAWTTTSRGVAITASHVLEPTATGVRNILSVDVQGPLSWLVGPLVRRSITKAIDTENRGFKRAADHEVS